MNGQIEYLTPRNINRRFLSKRAGHIMADAPFLGSDANEGESQIEASAAGIAIALEGAKNNPHLTGPITEFLAEQRALIADQRHHLGEQLKRLRLNIIDQRMSIVLKIMTAAMGLVMAVGVWVPRSGTRRMTTGL